MPRNSTETVYGVVSERIKNRLSTTENAVTLGKTACNHLSATIMVAILPEAPLSRQCCELLDSQSQIWPSRLFSGKQDPRIELPLTFWASIWRKTILQASRISKLAAITDDTEIKRTYTYRLYGQFSNIRGFPGFSGNGLTCANSGYQATLFFPRVAWVRGYFIRYR